MPGPGPVSANSEKGRGSEWAVRVGQRLPSRFVQSGAAREMNLVQIVVEAPAIRGVCQALSRHSLFLAGAARSVLVDYREGLSIRSLEIILDLPFGFPINNIISLSLGAGPPNGGL